MNEKISQIIDELIALDPTFASHRPELEKILLSVVSAKPDVSVDPDFVRSLRLKLSQKLDSKPKNNFMKKIIFAASAAVVVLLVVVVGLETLNLGNKNKNPLTFGSDVQINHTGDKAFGSLATLSIATNTNGTSNPGGAAPLASNSPQAGFGMGGGGPVSDKMIAPYEPVNYTYVYKGDDLNLSTDKLDVLQKQNPDSSSLLSGVQGLGLGLVNLDSFPGSKVQSVSLNQDNGYNVYVDFVGGMVSISSNYGIMPLAAGANAKLCPVDGCPTPNPIQPGDIPDDATLISIANQFLSDHGISTSAYGDPVVNSQFRVQNESMLKANPSALVYWPESVDVVFPLKVSGGEVYDESGMKMGLTVSVGIRNKQVTSVYNLSTLAYQASSYDAETDSSRILKIAQAGGLYGGVYNDPNIKTVEIDLGTPTTQYVSMWDYQNNVSQQVLVPSLVFPLINPPDGFYQHAIVVPLIKDILDRYSNNGVGGPVKIMNQATPAVAPAPKQTR